MADHWKMAGLKHMADGNDWASMDVRAILCMTNTTADVEDDGKNIIDDFTTLDRCDDTGYADQAIANEATARDDANNRIEHDGDNVTFANNGDASRDVAGMLLVDYVDGTNDIPLLWLDETISLDGNDVDVQWDAEGIGQETQA